MREYSTSKYPGPDGRPKWRRVDLETVMLNGRLAYDLDQWEIYRQLKKTKTPRITDCVGKDEMIFLYWLAQQETIERAEAAGK